ncbi:MAG: membrane protein insertase YidC [Candidatus Sumerlaeota bacterium]|nr:membrane protein insertase YidC [Candidatus Sumerlaeota bacterium]
MDRRWLLFLLLSFVIIQLFATLMQRNQPAKQTADAGKGKSTTSTLAKSHETSAAMSVQAAAETSRTPAHTAAAAEIIPAKPRLIENTSISIVSHPGEITTTTTNKYAIGIDSTGAVIHSWRLLDPGSESFEQRMDNREGIELVRKIPALLPSQPPAQTWPLQISFSEQAAYSYEEFNNIKWTRRRAPAPAGNDGLLVYESPALRGVSVTKSFEFDRDGYMSLLQITLRNDSASTIPVYDDTGRGLIIRWGPGLVERNLGDKPTGEEAYDAAVFRMDDQVRAAYPKPNSEPVEADGRIQWSGVESKFFTAILIPVQPDDAARKQRFFFRALVPGAHNLPTKDHQPPLTMELATDRLEIPPGSNQTFTYKLYVGPKKYRTLNQYGAALNLQTLMFHDAWPFMRVIYLFLTDLLNWIFKYVHNYGVAIIMLTVLVRLVTFPLTQHSIRIQAKSMAEMQKIKPYLDQINEKYKDNPNEKNKQTWKVYKEHNISPFGALRGCVPMILQLPVFYGLYRVSNDTIDLQGAHFLWIKDLSQPDHLVPFGMMLPFVGAYLNLLPILMGLTQMLATWISMARLKSKLMDPTQKQMMYFMPLFMIFILYSMPAGLMIYWNASNVWQIFQTLLTNRQLAREEERQLKKQAVAGVPPPPPPPPPAADGKTKKKNARGNK